MELLNKALEFLASGSVQAWVVCAYVIVEAALGLTDKIPFNSSLEGILKGAFEALKWVKSKAAPKKE
jgi:hypothetical protein